MRGEPDCRKPDVPVALLRHRRGVAAFAEAPTVRALARSHDQVEAAGVNPGRISARPPPRSRTQNPQVRSSSGRSRFSAPALEGLLSRLFTATSGGGEAGPQTKFLLSQLPPFTCQQSAAPRSCSPSPRLARGERLIPPAPAHWPRPVSLRLLNYGVVHYPQHRTQV